MKSRGTVVLVLMLSMVLTGTLCHAASEGGGSQWTQWKLLWRVIDFLALAALLAYLLKKPLAKFFSERKAQIVRDLEEAKDQRDRAHRIIDEYRDKIAGMAQELEKMRAELRKLAEADSEKVLINAERMSTAMVESAKVTAAQELRKAKIELRNEAVDLAVDLAETLIRERISEDDRKRIVEDYLLRVGGMK